MPAGSRGDHVASVGGVQGVVRHRVRSGHEGFSDGFCAELILAIRASVNVFLVAKFVGGHMEFVLREVAMYLYMVGN